MPSEWYSLASGCYPEPRCRRQLSAPPPPPAARREAIVSAVLPFLVKHGTSVTSRDRAAAGVAEGTIFKAFQDKDDLYAAVMARAIDPEPVERRIKALEPDVPFEERLVTAAVFMQRRLLDIWSLFGSIGASVVPPDQRRMPDSRGAHRAVRRRLPPRSHAARLAARQFRSLVLALSHPILNDPAPPAEEIVEMFLHGVAAHR